MIMKRQLLKWVGAATVFALTGLIGACIATAADPPQTEPGRPARGAGGPGGGGNGPGPRGGGGFGGGMALDEQQRELFREANQKNADQLRALDEKLRAAQKELVKATLAEKYDEKAVREKAEAVAKVKVEMTTLRAK